MNDYRPNPGDWTLITLHARCLGDGIGGTLVYRVDGVSGEALTISSGEDAFVRAEPLPKLALPTAFGSRIMAAVGNRDGDDRVELVRADPDNDAEWTDRGGDWFSDADLSDVEVLHDPDQAGRDAPVEDAAPEPVELPTVPTGLGAVVKAQLGSDIEADRDTVYTITRSDTGRCSWKVLGGRWLTDDEVRYEYMILTVLSPGVEVELP